MAKNSRKYAALGAEIKRLRTAKGITQEQLGDLCKVGKSAISGLERGESGFRASSDTARNISAALDVPVSHWFQYTSDGAALAAIAGQPAPPKQKTDSTQPTLVYKGPVTTRLIPYWGVVAAGKPFNFEDAEPTEMIEALDLPHGGEWIAFTISGESMDNDGLPDGAMVYVRIQPSAEHGDRVVAWMREGGYVVKKLAFEPDREGSLKGTWFLISRYKDKRRKPKPTVVDGINVRVVGKVKRVLQDFDF